MTNLTLNRNTLLKFVKVFALGDDLEERGIREGNCISRVRMTRGGDVAGLMDDHEQVWHW